MSTLCERCHLNENCSTLCETAEVYVSQDHVAQQHYIPTENICYSKAKIAISEIKRITKIKTKKGLIIHLSKYNKLKQVDIARITGTTKQYVWEVIKKNK
jgi:DNA-directed RNA polymerase specialized sigma subunit